MQLPPGEFTLEARVMQQSGRRTLPAENEAPGSVRLSVGQTH
jgi:hypothetical protein